MHLLIQVSYLGHQNLYQILALNDNNDPYIDSNIAARTFLGNSLKVLFNDPISGSTTGLYNNDTASIDYNPTGWYSYKIVVKQTEQEYYNVYLPGVMAAYPEDINKELYIASINGGIYKIVDAALSNNSIITDSFNYFPNPFKDKIEIQSDTPIDIELYNLSGVLIKSFKSFNDKTLNLSDLSSGAYIMKINNHKYRKLIKK